MTNVHVQPNGYSAGDGFTTVDNFPLARARKAFGDGTYVCFGNVGKLTEGGHPHNGHSCPAGNVVIRSGDGQRARIETLEFWANQGIAGIYILENVDIKAMPNSKAAVASDLVGVRGGALRLFGCDLRQDQPGNIKWGIRTSGWAHLQVEDCTFGSFHEHSVYPDSIGTLTARNNHHEGSGRTAWHYCSRPMHGPAASATDTMLFSGETITSKPGGGGGLITVAGYTGRGVTIENCEITLGEGAANRSAITIWNPVNDPYGQYMLTEKGEVVEVMRPEDVPDLIEEHGQLYGTRHALIANCEMRMDRGERTAIELTGVQSALVKGRMVWEGDFGKSGLHLDPYSQWPSPNVTLGWKEPSEWPGFRHFGPKVKRNGSVLSDEQIDAMGTGR